MEDSPPPNEDVGEENEQETEEERCQYFSSSSAFKFMTDGEFERVEGVKGGEESEYAFCYVRPMNAVVGVLDNPHGSVRLTQGKVLNFRVENDFRVNESVLIMYAGDTTVIAAVYGPSDVRMSKEMPHRAAVDVLFRPKVTGSANTNTMISLGFMGAFYFMQLALFFNLTNYFKISCYRPSDGGTSFRTNRYEYT